MKQIRVCFLFKVLELEDCSLTPGRCLFNVFVKPKTIFDVKSPLTAGGRMLLQNGGEGSCQSIWY